MPPVGQCWLCHCICIVFWGLLAIQQWHSKILRRVLRMLLKVPRFNSVVGSSQFISVTLQTQMTDAENPPTKTDLKLFVVIVFQKFKPLCAHYAKCQFVSNIFLRRHQIYLGTKAWFGLDFGVFGGSQRFSKGFWGCC